MPYAPGSIERTAFQDLDAIWHAAAFMPYSPSKLGEAFDFNVVGTAELYRQLHREAPGAHFFYVSSAYVGGLGDAPVPEAVLPSPSLNNAYLVTKWGAEMSLLSLANIGGPSITLYRPPGVVGHSESGFYNGKPYGMYLFFTALKAAAASGAKMARMDIDPDVLHPYLPVDDLSANAVSLTRGARGAPPLRVLHDLGTWHSNRVLLEIAAEVLGLTLGFGSAESDTDALIDGIIMPRQALQSSRQEQEVLVCGGGAPANARGEPPASSANAPGSTSDGRAVQPRAPT